MGETEWKTKGRRGSRPFCCSDAELLPLASGLPRGLLARATLASALASTLPGGLLGGPFLSSHAVSSPNWRNAADRSPGGAAALRGECPSTHRRSYDMIMMPRDDCAGQTATHAASALKRDHVVCWATRASVRGRKTRARGLWRSSGRTTTAARRSAAACEETSFFDARRVATQDLARSDRVRTLTRIYERRKMHAIVFIRELSREPTIAVRRAHPSAFVLGHIIHRKRSAQQR